MARSRNIKPGFFQNDELAEIEPLGRLLFAGLWTIADKAGRLEYRPKKIKVAVLPYDNCDIKQLLDELKSRKFITIYTVDEKTYIQINNWDKHQNPHKNEPESEIPAPIPSIVNSSTEKIGTSTELIGSNTEKLESTRADSLNLIPDSLNIDSLNSCSKEQRADAPSSKLPKTINNSVVIAELVDEYRKIIPEKKHQAGDYAFIGKLYNDHGYDVVLKAMRDLSYKTTTGFTPEKPLIYLKAMIENTKPPPQKSRKIPRGFASIQAQVERSKQSGY